MKAVKLSLLLVLLVSSSAFYSQEKYYSLLWKISGNNMEKPSYLYGTMHVSKKLAFHLSDDFFTAIEGVDMIALETNPEDWLNETVQTSSFISVFETLNDMGRSSNFYESAFKLEPVLNQNLQAYLQQDYGMINNLLYRYAGDQSDYEEQTYLDLFIYQTGKRLNKKINALEDFTKSLEMVMEASKPDKDDVPYTNQSDLVKNGKSIGQQIEDAYRVRDLNLLDSLQTLSNPSKNYRKYMLTLRNEIMAHNMDSLMKTNSLFTGIGAAHLPGKDGVISLLRSMGYTVEPVKYVQSKKADKLKTKFENLTYEVTFKDYHSADNFIHTVLPQEPVEFPQAANVRTTLYTDMANGAYYSLLRVNTWDLIFNRSMDYTMKRIDSLLFENIPGEILKKEQVEISGFPGYDIYNKTVKGDIQHYNIVVTPIEIIIAKTSGIKKYAEKKTLPFFTSLAFNHKKETTEYIAPGGDFSVKFPATYLSNKSSDLFKYVSVNPSANAFIDGKLYGAIKISLSDFEHIEEDQFEITQLLNYFNFNNHYKAGIITYSKLSEYPSGEVRATSDNGMFSFQKIIKRGQNYYLFYLFTNEDKTDEAFFESIQLKPFNYQDEEFTYSDSTMLFDSKVYFKQLMQKEEETGGGLFGGLFGGYLNTKEKLPYDSKYYSDVIKDPKTGESINMALYRYSRYYGIEDTLKYWDNKYNQYVKDGLIIPFHELKKDEKSNGYVFDIIQTDTNSSEAFYVTSFIHEGGRYTIEYISDTVSGKSEFYKTFRENFIPFADTVLSPSVFVDKEELFFKDIQTKDSAIIHSAITNMDYMYLDNKYFVDYATLIDTLNFKNYEDPVREDLLKRLKMFDTTAVYEYIEKKYKSFSDTAKLQVYLLNALSNIHTEESCNTFKKLMEYEVPLSKQKYTLNAVFNNYADSLELAKNLYPDVLKYTKYEEYKDNIYKLLAKLVDSSLIDAKQIEAYKNDILTDCKIELKREQSGSSNTYYYNTSNSSTVNLLKIASLFEGEDIDKLFEKVIYLNDYAVKFAIYNTMEERKMMFPDSIFVNALNSVKNCTDAAYYLHKLNRDSLIDATISQQDLAKSDLYSRNYDPKEDTVEFIEAVPFTYLNNKKGILYLYRSKEIKGNIWDLDMVAYAVNENGKVSTEEVFKQKGIALLNTSVEEEKEEVLLKLYSLDRKRAGNLKKENYNGLFGY